MIVYLDLDGVLVDFNRVICEQFGLSYPPKIYDFFEGIKSQVNAICGVNLFANLKWMHDGHDILRLITHYFNPHDIYLLTTPMPNLQSAWGKAEWVNKHLPEYNKRLIITRAPKKLMAGSGTLLIDDKDENVDGFRQAGGHAILIARPWNCLHAESDYTVQLLERNLKAIWLQYLAGPFSGGEEDG